VLWYKLWVETRARFLISLAGIFLLCSFSVFYGERQAEPWSPPSYYNYVLTEKHALLVIMWLLAVTLLMMGGLLREQAVGSVAFTPQPPSHQTEANDNSD
jgi:ABC-2 type transport system permease protein